MTRLLHVAGLATTLISHSPAAADTPYTCGAGVVRAVERVTETTIRETATTGRDAVGGPVVIDHAAERHQRQVYVVRVQLGDRLYTSASAGDPNGTLDPLDLAVGGAIGICVNAAQMVLEHPDGTDYRAPLAAVPATCNAPTRDTCDLVP
jgi:hypothetical protein